MLCASFAAVPAIAQVGAAGTVPGTVVANTATVRWTIAGEAGAASSNTDRLIVAERLDVRLAPRPAGPAESTALPVVLTNAGSGDEAFAVAASPSGDPATTLTLVVDVDGDGRCDPAVDRAPLDGRTPTLSPGASVRLLVCDADGGARVTARAVTGSGAPGTVFAGAGDGGGDAVVGTTGAAASLLVGDPAAGGAGGAPTLVKSQSVVATDGSARAAAGSTITYTLAAGFAAPAADAAVEDALPAGTAFVPGSLRLDGAALSEAEDGDAGAVVAGTVRVRLGDVPAGTDHRITFAVTVNP